MRFFLKISENVYVCALPGPNPKKIFDNIEISSTNIKEYALLFNEKKSGHISINFLGNNLFFGYENGQLTLVKDENIALDIILIGSKLYVDGNELTFFHPFTKFHEVNIHIEYLNEDSISPKMIKISHSNYTIYDSVFNPENILRNTSPFSDKNKTKLINSEVEESESALIPMFKELGKVKTRKFSVFYFVDNDFYTILTPFFIKMFLMGYHKISLLNDIPLDNFELLVPEKFDLWIPYLICKVSCCTFASLKGYDCCSIHKKFAKHISQDEYCRKLNNLQISSKNVHIQSSYEIFSRIFSNVRWNHGDFIHISLNENEIHSISSTISSTFFVDNIQTDEFTFQRDNILKYLEENNLVTSSFLRAFNTLSELFRRYKTVKFYDEIFFCEKLYQLSDETEFSNVIVCPFCNCSIPSKIIQFETKNDRIELDVNLCLHTLRFHSIMEKTSLKYIKKYSRRNEEGELKVSRKFCDKFSINYSNGIINYDDYEDKLSLHNKELMIISEKEENNIYLSPKWFTLLGDLTRILTNKELYRVEYYDGILKKGDISIFYDNCVEILKQRKCPEYLEEALEKIMFSINY